MADSGSAKPGRILDNRARYRQQGSVLGMEQTPVKPPLAAARVPCSRYPLRAHSRAREDGHAYRQDRGTRYLPDISRTAASPASRLDATAAILSPSIKTSQTSSRPAAGSTTWADLVSRRCHYRNLQAASTGQPYARRYRSRPAPGSPSATGYRPYRNRGGFDAAIDRTGVGADHRIGLHQRLGENAQDQDRSWCSPNARQRRALETLLLHAQHVRQRQAREERHPAEEET